MEGRGGEGVVRGWEEGRGWGRGRLRRKKVVMMISFNTLLSPSGPRTGTVIPGRRRSGSLKKEWEPEEGVGA